MTNANEASGPLAGVRVLEFSLIFSAPFAGVHLSDLGADVIKVEQLGGEPFRNLGTPVPGHSKTFQWANRGKRSLTLDLSRPEGIEVVRRLLPATDVVLINYRAGVAKRLGIDYESLRAVKPDLIYADINGFGSEGPLADQPASDMVAQAYGGTVAIDGKLAEDGAPDWPSIPIGDLTAGIATTMGICAALFHRAQTGEGQYVSISLLRVVMQMAFTHMMIEPVNDAVLRDFVTREVERVRAAGGSYDELIRARQVTAGRGSPMSIYWRGYRAKDGGIVLGALTAGNRDAIRAVVGIEGDPTDQPGYDGTDPRNHELVEQIKDRVREIMLTRTVDEWMRAFRAAGAPAAEVRLPEDLPDDPQAGLHMTELRHEITGPQRVVRPLADMSASPTAARFAAPVAGADNARVLAELGGFSRAEVEALRRAKVID
jgi:formyl-CoA transferase